MSPRTDGVIHDIGYRHYDGPRLGEPYIVRSLFIDSLRGAFGLGRATRTKVMPFLLLAVMGMPAFLSAVILNFSTGATEVPIEYTQYTFIFFFVPALFVASQAPAIVSRDLRHRVMSLYLSRPLSRLGYVVAKFAAMTCALLIITGLPLLVMFAGALLADLPVATNLRELAEGLVGALVLSLVLAGIGVLIASVTLRRGLGVAAIIAVLIVSAPVAQILQALGDESNNESLRGYSGLANPFTVVDSLQAWLFGVEPAIGPRPPAGLGGPIYLLVTLLLIGGSFALINRRYGNVSVS